MNYTFEHLITGNIKSPNLGKNVTVEINEKMINKINLISKTGKNAAKFVKILLNL